METHFCVSSKNVDVADTAHHMGMKAFVKLLNMKLLKFSSKVFGRVSGWERLWEQSQPQKAGNELGPSGRLLWVREIVFYGFEYFIHNFVYPFPPRISL